MKCTHKDGDGDNQCFALMETLSSLCRFWVEVVPQVIKDKADNIQCD